MDVSRSFKGPITSCGRQSSLYESYNTLWVLAVPLRVLQHVGDVSCPSTSLQNDVGVNRLFFVHNNFVDVCRPLRVEVVDVSRLSTSLTARCGY